MPESHTAEMIVKTLVGICTFLAVSSIGAVFFMWNSLNTIQAQTPLREALEQIKSEQMRQGIQLNSAELDVLEQEIDSVEERVDDLEDEHND